MVTFLILIYSMHFQKSLSPTQRINPLKDSAILSLKDYDRIRSCSQHPVQTEPSNNLSKSTNIQSLKEKIITYDKTAKYKPDFRDFDKEYIASKSGNTKQSDYELDIIKQMNTLMTSAKVSTIRDRQLDERKQMDDTDRNKEKRIDLMMEMERLKEIQIQEEKEIHSRKLQKEGAKVIIAQIRENTIERLKKKELKQRERMQMLRQIEVIKEEDIKSAEAKRKENAIVMKEALLANEIALLSKQMKKIENKQFDLTLLTHSLEQAKKEEELLKERKRIQEEKEIELQLLRSKQEMGKR